MSLIKEEQEDISLSEEEENVGLRKEENENISLSKEEKENILSGFQVDKVTLLDVDSGRILWTGSEDYSSVENDFEVKLPRNILQCRKVVRECRFTSVEYWDNLNIKHIMTYKGNILEETSFNHGPVFPNTHNTWLSTFETAPEAEFMPLEILSGNLIAITKFFHHETLITKSRCRIFYV